MLPSFIESPFPTKAEYERWCALQDSAPVALIDLPDDIWPSVVAHSLDAYLALPLLVNALSASFAIPKLRVKCLQRLLVCAAAADASGVPSLTEEPPHSGCTLSLTEQLSRRAMMMRLRGHIRSLAIRAIRAHDMEALRESIDHFGLLDPSSAHGLNSPHHTAMQLLRECMIGDFAPGVEMLLSREPVELPECGSPAVMQQAFEDGPIRPELIGQTVLQMAPADLPDFNPLFIGVRFGSLAATRTLLERLFSLERVTVRGGEGVASVMTGGDYAARALNDTYVCCGKLAMPSFGCGSAQGRFFCRVGPEIAKAMMAPITRWTLLQMEMRKADTHPAMVQTLLGALARRPGAEQRQATASDLSAPVRFPESHPDMEPLRKLLAAKRRALEVMAAPQEGQDADGALRAALEAAEALPLPAPPAAGAEDAPPIERDPNLLLKEGGWFGVNPGAERVANFEAAAALVEDAFPGMKP